MSAPVISERVEKALRDIGLTEYESQAYLSLLSSGEDTAEAVSQMTPLYDVKTLATKINLENRLKQHNQHPNQQDHPVIHGEG